jgi:S-adenosylmethionine-diacylglycerol 3-amino-3-carboxypropyl transferase
MTNAYFLSHKLNYTYVNEDHIVEHELLAGHSGHVVAVAGSGTRLVPLLAQNPERVTLIDISADQVMLSRFRHACIKAFSRADYMSFFGYAGSEPIGVAQRKDMFASLPKLDAEVAEYMRIVLENNSWGPIVPLGRWEQTFASIAKLVKKVIGEKVANEIFSISDQTEYNTYLSEKFPWKRWDFLTMLLSNSMFFNVMLYGRQFPKLNVADGFGDFYSKSLRSALQCCPARQNFFIQILFFGRVVYPEALTLDVDANLYRLAKESNSIVEIKQGNLLRDAGSKQHPISLFAVSDVPSYFRGDMARDWLQLVREQMAPGGMLIARYYRHVPEATNYAGWHNQNHRYTELCKREKTQMYRYDILQHLD